MIRYRIFKHQDTSRVLELAKEYASFDGWL